MSPRVQAIVLALLLAPYFVNLSEPDLWDANESLYAEPPREALETGAWLAPPMNYETWFVKPPGATWALMPFYALLGPTELAARLPLALAAAATILLTWDMTRRVAGPRAALLAAAVLATTAKQLIFSRQLAGDVLLVLCFAAAAHGYLRWLASGGARRGGLLLGGLALGLGVLVKGPVALLLPAIALAAHRLVARDGLRVRPLAPLAVALAVGAPWFVYMTARFGSAFTDVYFLEHHLQRAFTTMFGGGRGPGFYPLAYLGDALPWSVALPGAVVFTALDGRGGGWRRDPRTLPLLWSAIVFLAFSASTGKRSVYLMPVYPAVGMAVGITIDRLAERRAGWILWPLLGVPLVGLAATVALVAIRHEFLGIASGSVILVGWALGLVHAIRRRDVVKGAWVSAAGAALIALWAFVHLGELDPYRPARTLAERVAAEAQPGDLSGRYDAPLQSLSFYGRRPFFSERDPEGLRRRCREAPRTFVVMPEESLGILTEDPSLRVDVLEKRPYLQMSLPGLLGRKPWERTLVLVRVTEDGSGGAAGGGKG
jgi:4-amino-4-deoxy-L-arabinose transferase-like glycosyltransferase